MSSNHLQVFLVCELMSLLRCSSECGPGECAWLSLKVETIGFVSDVIRLRNLLLVNGPPFHRQELLTGFLEHGRWED